MKVSPFCFLYQLHHFASPQTIKSSSFSTNILTNTCCLFLFFFFGNSYPDRCEVIPLCAFDLHFTHGQWYWAFFIYLLTICISSLEKCLFKSLACFFCWVIRFFCFCIVGVPCIFWMSIIRCIVCKCFLPFHGLPFHFVDCFLCCAGASLFYIVPLDYFCFLLLVLLV